MSWDFGSHAARDSCILKTETHQFPLKLANGDPVDPADPAVTNSTSTTFLGTNTSTVYSNGMDFETLLADSTRLTDATIPCVGNLSYTIPDRFIDNDIQLFATFGEIINPGDILSHDLGDYKLVDTVDEETKNTTNNLNTLHEISIQYSDYIEFAPVQCGGANAWEIGTEYFKDIYTEDTIIELQPKLICTLNSDGESTNPDGTSGNSAETTTTADSALPTTGDYYLVYSTSSSSDGGCIDCVDPTFYDSENKNIVKDGFVYNNYSTDVNATHTKTPPLITNVNQTNVMKLKVYDNSGISEIEWVDVGFGIASTDDSFDNSEAIIEIEFFNNVIKDITIIDIFNLVDFGNVTSSIVSCGYVGTNCLEVTIPHMFRDTFEHKMVVIRAQDQSNNRVYNYMNDGIEIHGESINEAPTDRVFIQKYIGNTEWEWLDITRTDRINDIWASEDGIQFQRDNGGGFQRMNPIDFEDVLTD